MKKQIIISSFLLVVSSYHSLEAACNTGAIIVSHESGFGISFGSSSSKASAGDSSAINIPLTINDQQACFHKKTKFSMKAENSNESQKGKITITPMKVDFENVPDPGSRQYIFVEKNDEISQTKFHVMSFVCAGEIPLSVEAISDSYSKILHNSDTAEIHVRTVFATGKAAEILGKSQNALSSQGTFDFFAKLYKEKTLKELDIPPCCGQKIPSIITDSSINALSGVERSIASSFTTLGARVPNGCSKDFSTAMSQYLLENFEQNDSLKDYKVKKKFFSDDISFEWK